MLANIRSRPSDNQIVENPFTNFAGHILKHTFPFGRAVFSGIIEILNHAAEERIQFPSQDIRKSTLIGLALEKIDLIAKVNRGVVLRSSGEKADKRGFTRAELDISDQGIQILILLSLVVSEIMTLINHDEAVIVIAKRTVEFFTDLSLRRGISLVNEFTKTAGRNKTHTVTNFIYCVPVKINNSLFPSFLDSRRCDD